MSTDTLAGCWQLIEEQNGDGALFIRIGAVRQASPREDTVVGQQFIRMVDGLAQGNMYLDCEKVANLQAGDLGKLIVLWKKLKADGRRLLLYNVRPQVYEVFEVTHLTKLMEICTHGPP